MGIGQFPARDRGDAGTSDAVLCRLVLDELGERWAVRRRVRAGGGAVPRAALPHHSEALCAAGRRRVDEWMADAGAAAPASRFLRRGMGLTARPDRFPALPAHEHLFGYQRLHDSE